MEEHAVIRVDMRKDDSLTEKYLKVKEEFLGIVARIAPEDKEGIHDDKRRALGSAFHSGAHTMFQVLTSLNEADTPEGEERARAQLQELHNYFEHEQRIALSKALDSILTKIGKTMGLPEEEVRAMMDKDDGPDPTK